MSGVELSEGNRIGRSIGALFAGFAVGIVLSVGTDLALHAAGVTPPSGEAMPDSMLLLAAAYRTLYGVIASYVVASLAPNRPMQHALLGGLVGMFVCILGAVETWYGGMGSRWYSVALVVLAMPPAWVGGKLRVLQQGREDGAEFVSRDA